MLFKKLPSEIFRPLAGGNRNIFQEILLVLYPVFFDEMDAEEIFPRREELISQIEETLGHIERLKWEREEDENMDPFPSIPRCASFIYQRLLNTGWLEEIEDGYHKRVVMPPVVSALLTALINISQFQKKNYGGTVLGILASLEAVVADPVNRALTLPEAVKATKDFTSHLNSIVYGLREVQEKITSSRDPKTILATFFDEFVADILIADYKTLQAENNPFRFRREIIRLLTDLQHDEEKLTILRRVYREDSGGTNDQAAQRVHSDIRLLTHAFESVDKRLAVIDLFRLRLEAQVANTVRYMDKTRPGARARLARILEGLSNMSGKDAENIPAPETFMIPLPLGPGSIKVPTKRRAERTIQVFRERTIDAKAKAHGRMLLEYQKRRQITPAKIEGYLEKHLNGRTEIRAAEFIIRSVEDYIAFTHIRHMAEVDPTRRLIRKYRVESAGGLLDNPWLECVDFVVKRRI